jgi:hypothetical protein
MIWLSIYLTSRLLKQRKPEAYGALRQSWLPLMDKGRRSYHTLTGRLVGLPVGIKH